MLSNDPSLQLKNYYWNSAYYTYDEITNEFQILEIILFANVLANKYSLSLRYNKNKYKLAFIIIKKGIINRYLTTNITFTIFKNSKDILDIDSKEEFNNAVKILALFDLNEEGL